MASWDSRPHFVLGSLPVWCHIRPLLVLASKIVATRNIHVTLLFDNHGPDIDKIPVELERRKSEEGPIKGRIRLITLGKETDHSPRYNHKLFQEACLLLMHEEPFKCSITGKTSFASMPSVFILDVFQMSQLGIVKSKMRTPAPILLWMPHFSGAFLRAAGPEFLGGNGDYLRAVVDEDLEYIGEPGQEQNIEGKIINIPGMPKMYDWEFYPQKEFARSQWEFEMLLAKSTENLADGVITTSTPIYDGKDCLNAITSWIAQKNNRPVFHLGPMLLPILFKDIKSMSASIQADITASNATNGKKEHCMRFLNQNLRRRGEHSVVYINFGTRHWPSSMEHLKILLAALERRSIPVILACPCPHGEVPSDIVQAPEAALIMRWAPQQAILFHKACGWFVTSGGFASSIEALSQGVPIIGWPFTNDQPLNIRHLSRILDCAFELTETRTENLNLNLFHEAKKAPSGTPEAFATEVEATLDAMAGPEGEKKRANATAIKEQMKDAWTKDGKARMEFERFLERTTRRQGREVRRTG